MAANDPVGRLDMLPESEMAGMTGAAGLDTTKLSALAAKKTELVALAGVKAALLALADKKDELLALLETEPAEPAGGE